jgi:hypothetical protein
MYVFFFLPGFLPRRFFLLAATRRSSSADVRPCSDVLSLLLQSSFFGVSFDKELSSVGTN